MSKIEIVLVIMVVARVVNLVTGTPAWCWNGDEVKNEKCGDHRCCIIWCNGDNSICNYPR